MGIDTWKRAICAGTSLPHSTVLVHRKRPAPPPAAVHCPPQPDRNQHGNHPRHPRKAKYPALARYNTWIPVS